MRARYAVGLMILVLGAQSAVASDLPEGVLNSSRACGICHRDIYEMWSGSAHARSMDGPVFLDALVATGRSEGEGLTRVCLKCHAPLADALRDVRLERTATWDGVSCNACHSLSAVEDAGGNPSMIFDLGKVKRGPMQHAQSDAHGVLYSSLHSTSELCMGCHEYANGDGTKILSTYSEWQESASAAEGRTCQDCHMGRTETTEVNVVDPKRKSGLFGGPVGSHAVPGGHSLSQLHKAVRVVMRCDRQGDDLALEVRITNRGAGHAVPTGMPGRRLILDVEVRTGEGISYKEQRLYTKTYVGPTGEPVAEEGSCFVEGVRLQSDTRLKSGEERIESFRFTVPVSSVANVGLRVHYEHAPTASPEHRTWLTVFSEDRIVKPS